MKVPNAPSGVHPGHLRHARPPGRPHRPRRQLPAAVLAGLLHLVPAIAVRWMHEAGEDWSRHAAELVRERAFTTPDECPRRRHTAPLGVIRTPPVTSNQLNFPARHTQAIRPRALVIPGNRCTCRRR
jgi:hypothetical protein